MAVIKFIAKERKTFTPAPYRYFFLCLRHRFTRGQGEDGHRSSTSTA